MDQGFDDEEFGDDVMEDEETGLSDPSAIQPLQPSFSPISPEQITGGQSETRKIQVPPHRYTPLKNNWESIYTPLITHMKLQVRMNTKTRSVELRTSQYTTETGALQKGADFVRAFMLGFEINDAIALLRLDDIYVDSFEILDVKTLHGDNLSRAIGRIAGKDGKTKFTIENVTRTRIVLADRHVHIMGAYKNINVAKDAVVSLILGSPPGKVYAHLRNAAQRLNEQF